MYKKGQGMMSRSGILVLFVLFGLYTGFSWFKDMTMRAPVEVGVNPWMTVSYGTVGGVLLAVGLCACGVYLTLIYAKTSDFFIEMDIELRKVEWPKTQPLFDSKAEAWGATYVVIVTVIVMSLFIYVVDTFFQYVVQRGLLHALFT